MSRLTRLGKALVAGVFIVAGLTGISFASAPDSSSWKYYGCLNKGFLSSIQINTPPSCPKNFRLIQWNATGPQGIAGPQGANGITGASDIFKSTSSSNYTIGYGDGSIITGTNLSWTSGQAILVANDATHYVVGTVISYNSTTGELKFTVGYNPGNIAGSGNFSAWTINLAGSVGQPGYSGSDGLPGDSTVFTHTGIANFSYSEYEGAVYAYGPNYLVVADKTTVQKLSESTGDAINSPVSVCSGSCFINNLVISGDFLWIGAQDKVILFSLSSWSVVSSISAPEIVGSYGCGVGGLAANSDGGYIYWSCSVSSGGPANYTGMLRSYSNSGSVRNSTSCVQCIAFSIAASTSNVWFYYGSTASYSTVSERYTFIPTLKNINTSTFAATQFNPYPAASEWFNYNFGTLFTGSTNHVFVSHSGFWKEFDANNVLIRTYGLVTGVPQTKIGTKEYFTDGTFISMLDTSNGEIHTQALPAGAQQVLATRNNQLWITNQFGTIELVSPR